MQTGSPCAIETTLGQTFLLTSVKPRTLLTTTWYFWAISRQLGSRRLEVRVLKVSPSYEIFLKFQFHDVVSSQNVSSEHICIKFYLFTSWYHCVSLPSVSFVAQPTPQRGGV